MISSKHFVYLFVFCWSRMPHHLPPKAVKQKRKEVRSLLNPEIKLRYAISYYISYYTVIMHLKQCCIWKLLSKGSI